MKMVVHIDTPNNSQTHQLCKDYWATNEEGSWCENVRDIGSRYGIATHEVVKLVKQHAYAEVDTLLCNECQAPYPARSRSDALQPPRYHRGSRWHCDTCEARLEEEARQRKQQLEATRKEARDEVRRQLAHKIQERQPGDMTLGDLPPKQAIALFALIQMLIDEDKAFLLPLSQARGGLLTPSSDWTSDLIGELFGKGIIEMEPTTPDHAFCHDDSANELPRLYLDHIVWRVMVVTDSSTNDYSLFNVFHQLSEYLADPSYLRVHSEELLLLGERLVFEDCMAYLDYLLVARDLPPLQGKVTAQEIDKACQTLSTGQVHSLLFTAARAASDRLRLGEVYSRRHASNTIPSHLRNLVKKAKAEAWNIKVYERPPELPESTMSKVFFGHMLGEPNAAYHTVVPIWLEKRLIDGRIQPDRNT